jgi:hypothetical protein
MPTHRNQAPASRRRIGAKPDVSSTADGSLVLLVTDDGWRLVGRGGTNLFESHGRSTRPPRLEITHDGGDLEVIVRR